MDVWRQQDINLFSLSRRDAGIYLFTQNDRVYPDRCGNLKRGERTDHRVQALGLWELGRPGLPLSFAGTSCDTLGKELHLKALVSLSLK